MIDASPGSASGAMEVSATGCHRCDPVFAAWTRRCARCIGPPGSRFTPAIRNQRPMGWSSAAAKTGTPTAYLRFLKSPLSAAVLHCYAALICEVDVEENRASSIGQTIVRREPVGVVGPLSMERATSTCGHDAVQQISERGSMLCRSGQNRPTCTLTQVSQTERETSRSDLQRSGSL